MATLPLSLALSGCFAASSRDFLPESGVYLQEEHIQEGVGDSRPPRQTAVWVVADPRAQAAVAVDAENMDALITDYLGDNDTAAACRRVAGAGRRVHLLQIDARTRAMFENDSTTPSLPERIRVGDEWTTSREGQCTTKARIAAVASNVVRVDHLIRCDSEERLGFSEEWTKGRGRTLIAAPGGKVLSRTAFKGPR